MRNLFIVNKFPINFFIFFVQILDNINNHVYFQIERIFGTKFYFERQVESRNFVNIVKQTFCLNFTQQSIKKTGSAKLTTSLVSSNCYPTTIYQFEENFVNDI